MDEDCIYARHRRSVMSEILVLKAVKTSISFSSAVVYVSYRCFWYIIGESISRRLSSLAKLSSWYCDLLIILYMDICPSV